MPLKPNKKAFLEISDYCEALEQYAKALESRLISDSRIRTSGQYDCAPCPSQCGYCSECANAGWIK